MLVLIGKYLDLHTFFLRFCNLPNIPGKDQDYLAYLDKFNSFFYIPGLQLSQSLKHSGFQIMMLLFYCRIEQVVEAIYLLHL